MARILTAVALLSVLWPITELGPRWAFVAVAAAIIAVATWEGYRLMEARGMRPLKLLGVIATVGLVWAVSGLAGRSAPPAGLEPVTLLVAATVLAPLVAIWRRPDVAAMVDAIVGTLFPLLFIGLMLSFVVRLRAVDGRAGEDGRDLLYMLFACVILADTAAFYVGTAVGRNRLAPRISPKKSWEGAVGGVLASLLAGTIAHFWFARWLPLGHAALLGGVLGCAALLGDLAESMLKRWANVKDSSSVLPGHGGVLDRVDSLLFAAPILFYYHAWVLRAAA